MAQKTIFSVTAKKIKFPDGQFQDFSPSEDITVGSTEYVILPSGADDSLIVTSAGFHITVDATPANLNTAISATDATGT